MLTVFRAIRRSKSLVGILSLGFLLIAVFWVGNRPTLYILEEQKLSNAPDFFLEGINAKSFDQGGHLTETVEAKIANHYMQKRTELERPVIARINGDISSVASADTGIIDDTSDSFTLSQNAQITRYRDHLETAKIKANTLIYNDELQTIVGIKQSQLITPNGVTKSDTISFDLTDQTATLSGGITGQYEISNH